MPSKLLVYDKSLLHRLAELIWAFICEHLDMVSLFFTLVCGLFRVISSAEQTNCTKKTSSVVNQFSKIASSLVRKLKYGGADSRTWRARIVSKPSYAQFNIFF